MDQKFWLELWQQNRIGFHEEEINPHLQRYWPDFNLPAKSRVFVPLCGKSKDMLWLQKQSYNVVGVELCPLAISAFLAENELSANSNSSEEKTFTLTKTGNLTLYCGDFFNLTTDELPEIHAVYDRAALVALPADMRISYVNHLRHLLKPGVQILLIGFSYLQEEMQGPPFSVTSQEIEKLYGDWCDIALLTSEDILDKEPRFRERGLTALQEQVFALTVNP